MIQQRRTREDPRAEVGLYDPTRLVPAAKECDNAIELEMVTPERRPWIYGVNQRSRMEELYKATVMSSLEVLGNTRVSLLWENRGVLDPRVPSRGNIPNDRLLASAIWVVVTIRALLVVALVIVVLVGVTRTHAGVVSRSIGSIGSRV